MLQNWHCSDAVIRHHVRFKRSHRRGRRSGSGIGSRRVLRACHHILSDVSFQQSQTFLTRTREHLPV